MVKNGQPIVERFPFRPPHADAGVEVMDWADLRRRANAGVWRPHRTDFHQLLLVDAGRLTCHVDFINTVRRPRSLLWVRPGQVQQFLQQRRLHARLLLFEAHVPAPAAALRPMLDGPLPPSTWELTGDDYDTLSSGLEDLRAHAVTRGDSLRVELVRHLLTALLLRLATIAPAQPPPAPTAYADIYARLHSELERSFTRTRRAQDYAHHLGYTVKTLTRACNALTGMTVKQVIDARVILEAKRQLAHTDLPIDTLASQLGFSEATNFAKFFARHTGHTPGAFRATSRRSPPS